ncbi:Cyclic di-GMP phosphodiesterase Gmr [compost metagenome]
MLKKRYWNQIPTKLFDCEVVDNKIITKYTNDQFGNLVTEFIADQDLIKIIELVNGNVKNSIIHFVSNKDDQSYHISAQNCSINEVVISIVDVTTIKRVGDRAYRDVLTGIPNRAGLMLAIKELMPDTLAALLFLDLDKFKAVNDTLGHEAGDELLQQVSNRLASCVRGGDCVARIGGDEFVVLLPHLAREEFAIQVAERIITNLTTPFLLKQGEANIGTSIGIAFYPKHGTTADELIKKADEAMYAAKKAGRGRYELVHL